MTGANSLTFLIPAEIFPTTYRCFCHGISAAAGKLGSVVAVFMVYGINAGYESVVKQALIFLLFAFIGAIGVIFSWAYLPDVQRRNSDGKLINRSLEELGQGLKMAEIEGQVFTVRENWPLLWSWVKNKRVGSSSGTKSSVL
jgi:PHS family inorganic phosphate transporter-like MFS transporter